MPGVFSLCLGPMVSKPQLLSRSLRQLKLSPSYTTATVVSCLNSYSFQSELPDFPRSSAVSPSNRQTLPLGESFSFTYRPPHMSGAPDGARAREATPLLISLPKERDRQRETPCPAKETRRDNLKEGSKEEKERRPARQGALHANLVIEHLLDTRGPPLPDC